MIRTQGRRSIVAAIAVAVLIAAGPAGASQRDGETDQSAPYRRNALVFSVESLAKLSSFKGRLVTYERFLSERRSLRFSLGLSIDYEEQDYDAEYDGIDTTASYGVEEWDHEGTVWIQMLFYRGEEPLRVYYGAGPVVTYEDYHYEENVYSVVGDDLEHRYYGHDGSEWRVGIQGVFGVRWILSDRFALHAEYGATARYRLASMISQYFRTDNPDQSELIEEEVRSPQVISDGVLVGLSVLF